MSLVWAKKSVLNSACWENQVLPSAAFKKVAWTEHTVFQNKETSDYLGRIHKCF